LLSLDKTRQLLSINDFPLPWGQTITEITELQGIKLKIRYPCVLKAISPDFTHKSDVGGVILDIQNYQMLEKELKDMINRFNKPPYLYKVTGFLIEEMWKPQIEIVIGVKKDPSYGHVMMVGLGGIYVEVFQDVSFRLIPITREDAFEMLEELKSKDILRGIRGKPINIDSLVDLMLQTSQFVEKNPQILEFDMNPVGCTSDSCRVLDERMVFSD
jgi:hypothetical protein